MTFERIAELQELSWTLHADGRLAEAADACREALRLLEAAAEGTSEVGAATERTPRPDAADDVAARGAVAREVCVNSDGSMSLDIANLLNELAEIELEREHLAEALTLAERARAVTRAVPREDDTVAVAAADDDDETAVRIHLKTLVVAGGIRRMLGLYPEAATDLREALEIATDTFGDASEEAALACNNLGLLCKYWGRFDEGLQLYERALAAFVAIHGEDSLAAGTVYHNIGGILHASGAFTAAEAPARRAWTISRRQLGEDHPQSMRDAAAYAGVLDALGRHAESEQICRQALAVFERTYGPDHEEVAATLHNLAAVLEAQDEDVDGMGGVRHEAERCYRRALAIKERLFGHDSPDAALTLNNLGKLLIKFDRSDEAIPLLQRALSTLEARLPQAHPHLAAVRKNLREAIAAQTRDSRPASHA
jgi:tetratricopeptide (TPR) repeat protein